MTLPAGWEGYQHNFLGLEEPWCHPDRAGVYVLPAPYEHTSSYVLGSDRGPSAIIEASHQVEYYDEVLRCEPFREWGGIATLTPLDMKGKVDQQAVEAIEAFVAPHVGTGRLAVTLTGEHTGALGAIRAHAKRYPDLCMIQIDAHGDLRHAYLNNLYSHAGVMARVVDDGLPLVQVGIRSICPEEIERINSSDRISTFFAGQLLDPSGPNEGKASRWIPAIVKACRGPVYLTGSSPWWVGNRSARNGISGG
jgi:N1-aminopropylagmatine ureohydrolase